MSDVLIEETEIYGTENRKKKRGKKKAKSKSKSKSSQIPKPAQYLHEATGKSKKGKSKMAGKKRGRKKTGTAAAAAADGKPKGKKRGPKKSTSAKKSTGLSQSQFDKMLAKSVNEYGLTKKKGRKKKRNPDGNGSGISISASEKPIGLVTKAVAVGAGTLTSYVVSSWVGEYAAAKLSGAAHIKEPIAMVQNSAEGRAYAMPLAEAEAKVAAEPAKYQIIHKNKNGAFVPTSEQLKKYDQYSDLLKMAAGFIIALIGAFAYRSLRGKTLKLYCLGFSAGGILTLAKSGIELLTNKTLDTALRQPGFQGEEYVAQVVDKAAKGVILYQNDAQTSLPFPNVSGGWLGGNVLEDITDWQLPAPVMGQGYVDESEIRDILSLQGQSDYGWASDSALMGNMGSPPAPMMGRSFGSPSAPMLGGPSAPMLGLDFNDRNTPGI